MQVGMHWKDGSKGGSLPCYRPALSLPRHCLLLLAPSRCCEGEENNK